MHLSTGSNRPASRASEWSDTSENAGLAPAQLRILVADDERDAVLTLMMLLREEGHDVRGVFKGADVLRAMREFNPDAVLLDIRLPDLSGYEVAREIRGRYGSTSPLLVGLSGYYKTGSDRVLARIVGFDHFVTKPYVIDDLLVLIAPLKSPPT